ncbi:MAG TPA: CheR family methyltransferase [Gallionella sp.]|nr:CheR family methyltransferase [Gallionella sp.]
MNDTALLDELAQLAARRIGLRIPGDARDRFAGMLRERAALLGYASLKDYRTFLTGKQATGEWEKLARVFTSGETFFFRDHGQFDLLRLHLLPELIAQHRNDKTLHLWSAGCASGEEVYSLAMLVDMLLPERDDWYIHILGTDIDSEAIAKARRGRYGQWSFRMVPPVLQQRYFHLESNEWVLDERIRRMATFRVSNLVDEPLPDSASELDFGSELHGMDMILCRNVFIYFDPAAVSAVAAKFAATLHEGGYLLTAHTELIGHPVHELESRLFADGVVYQRRVQVPAPSPTLMEPLAIQPSPQAGKGQVAGYPPHAGDGTTSPHPNLTPQAGEGANKAPSLARSAGEAWPVLSLSREGGGNDALLKEARAYADRGEFDLAEHLCHKALTINPLAAAPYFLLAQLAQIKGDFNQARECLNKALYLDSHFVAAYLELAALCERAEDILRAQALRRAALTIVRTMPSNEIIEQYETTAGELTQWLAQWEHEPTEGTLKKSKS